MTFCKTIKGYLMLWKKILYKKKEKYMKNPGFNL